MAEVRRYRLDSYNDDRWHHFGFRTFWGGAGLYIDGQPREELRQGLLFNGTEIRIGENFIGLLDEICIYSPGLQAAEIQALAGKNPEDFEQPHAREK